MKLFEDQNQPKLKLKINKQFAEKYQKKKERELLDKRQDLLEQLSGADSDDSIEDENGDLINENVTSKFIETLAKIRYKHPDIYKNNETVFDDNDFEKEKKKKDKKLTYAEIQKDINPENENEFEEYEPQIGLTPEEEQKALKNAFKQAAQQTDANDLLKKKQKSKQEIEDADKEYQKFLNRQKKKLYNKPEEQDILQKFWGNEEELDEKDRFLRNYILTKGWIDKDQQSSFQDSSEDEEKMDKFEEEYNFRFEEPGGTQLVTFERDLPGTIRQEKESARQRQRKAKAEREKEEKLKLQKELAQLKIAKKNEIIEKIQKIQQVGGIKHTKQLLEEIQNNEFNAQEFDKKMDQIYNQEYFEEEVEENSKELEIENSEEEEDEQQENQDQTDKQNLDIDNVIKPKTNIPIIMKKNLNNEELQALKSEQVNIWWYCDYCKQSVKPGHYRWDCQVCDDYTLCENCNSTHNQNHKLKRILVPVDCFPPNDEDVEQILQQFKYCRACQIKMTDENDYYQSKKDYLCVDCYEKDTNQKRYTLVEADLANVNQMIDKDPEKLKHKLPQDVQHLVDEYYDLDFEDVIAGGLKCKFQYIDVPKDSFGLTNDDLLYADDKLLNQYVSIKKLAPYREEQIKLNNAKSQKILLKIRKSAKINKKLILSGKDPRENKQQQKEEQQIELEVEDNAQNNTLNVDAKRLKAYGI